jgi:hypothetical protein
MARTFDLLVAALALLLSTAPGTVAASEKPAGGGDAAFFEQEVLPLLKARCFKCHGEGKVRGGLQLTSREGILKGGEHGPAVVPAKPEASNLLRAINYTDGLEMPPSGKLPQREIDTLTRWVKAGLPWSTGSAAAVYWAYQPVRRPAVPAVKSPSWVRTPIDAFILDQLEAHGLAPAPTADRVALIRRATYDLTGLPPTPKEIAAFVNDRSADAYPRLLDRLLASPQYGEKWGRHWLDLVRYAETNGYERDGPKPFAWRYRDYVIRSFNDDKPYDRFIKEQLAGDELPDGGADAIIATGYYRLGLWDDEPADPLQARYDELDDYVATTSQVFLAMTMNCARCHDHKIDPLPQKDYYQLAAFFQDIQHYSDTREVRSRFNLTDIAPPAVRATYEADLKRREARKAELVAAMTAIEDDAIRKMPAEDQRAAEGPDRPQVLDRQLKKFLTPEQEVAYKRLQIEFRRLQRRPEPARQELALSVNHCAVKPVPTHVLMRGNPHVPGARVEPAFPEVLGSPAPTIPTPGPAARSSGRRMVLADWIASPDNRLTARVLVNRLWQHHFGRGIVPTPSDFGKFGEPPTHPELLDWLAREFADGGWRMKRLHKLLMLSSAYQMSSRASADGLHKDPANRLFWRFNMRRLSAEEVRDSMLAVSGRLNLKAGGPGVYPPIPKEVLAGQSRPGEGWGNSPPEEAGRRSVYAHVKRSLLVPILSQHDQADTDSSCPVRYTTTVPTQALGMLNGEFTREQAAALADRLRREVPGDLEGQVRRAILLTTGRTPSSNEVRKDLALIEALRANDKLTNQEALKEYALVVLNASEFVYLD